VLDRKGVRTTKNCRITCSSARLQSLGVRNMNETYTRMTPARCGVDYAFRSRGHNRRSPWRNRRMLGIFTRSDPHRERAIISLCAALVARQVRRRSARFPRITVRCNLQADIPRVHSAHSLVMKLEGPSLAAELYGVTANDREVAADAIAPAADDAAEGS